MEFINLKKQYELLRSTLSVKVDEIMSGAHFIGGQEVSELEERLAGYVGRSHCLGCGNGTEALQLAYMAYGVGAGDAVFCPAMTFIASVEPAAMLGATPVFCDIEPDTFNLSPSSLAEQIERVEREGKLRPRAVVAVDFLGNPARFDEISKICADHDLLLIEDAAQGTGATYKGSRCGSFGDIACTSFFPSKPLGCYGDGGAVYTDDDVVAGLLASLKVHGKGSSKYDNVRIGMNSRLDTIQAAVLLAKMDLLDGEMGKRQEVAARYWKAFEGKVQTPKITEDSMSSFAQFVLIAESEEQRDHVVASMKEAGVPSLVYYPKPLHQMKAFGGCGARSFPNAEHYAQCNFGIPFSPYITEEEQDEVVSAVLAAL